MISATAIASGPGPTATVRSARKHRHQATAGSASALRSRTPRRLPPGALSPSRQLTVSQAASTEGAVKQAKEDFTAALRSSRGDSKDPEVLQKLGALGELCAEGVVANTSLLCGKFSIITSPDFPDCLGYDSQGNPQYTLGRMSFGMFEPKATKCSILDIQNVVSDLGQSRFTYDIEVLFEVAGEGDAAGVQGIMCTTGFCQLSENTGEERGGRLSVTFTGGSISPGEGTDLIAWNSVFGESAVPPPGVIDKVVAWAMSTVLGIDKPLGGADMATGTQEFSMNRAPEGWLDIIFMDEEIRVTRGNRGSVVAVQRK